MYVKAQGEKLFGIIPVSQAFFDGVNTYAKLGTDKLPEDCEEITVPEIIASLTPAPVGVTETTEVKLEKLEIENEELTARLAEQNQLHSDFMDYVFEMIPEIA